MGGSSGGSGGEGGGGGSGGRERRRRRRLSQPALRTFLCFLRSFFSRLRSSLCRRSASPRFTSLTPLSIAAKKSGSGWEFAAAAQALQRPVQAELRLRPCSRRPRSLLKRQRLVVKRINTI